MTIFITGGTGFIGTALCQELVAQGHQLRLLTRKMPLPPNTQAVTFCHDFAPFKAGQKNALDGLDAVINLAGEPIFNRRWSAPQKQTLWDSRIQLTQKIATLINQSRQPPKIFLSGSATGIYGNFAENTNTNVQTEEHITACQQADSLAFPAQLCRAWENSALQARSEQTRVCLLRTGLVLAPTGGALQKMLPLYRLGLGGKLGNGQQHWAWISLQDQVRAICFLLANATSQGAYNLVAPHSVSNADFNRTLANAVNRPAICNVPKWGLQLALGERSQLLLDNQPLVPQRLLAEGFIFNHPTLATYLPPNTL